MNKTSNGDTAVTPRQLFRPDIDLLDGEHEITIVADLPGVRGEDIRIDYRDGTLSLQAPVSHEPAESFRVRHRESLRGDFYREFRVSDAIEAGSIDAEYRNGVLTLHLPKAASRRPRQIPVQVSSN